MTIYYHSLIILLLGFGFTPDFQVPAKKSTDWSLAKHSDGIVVYTRAVAGSNVKEFKAITFTDQSMDTLEALIEGVGDYQYWQKNVTTSKLLEHVSDTEMYIYYTTDIPWPLSDRDVVIHSKKRTNEAGAVTYIMSAMPNYIEPLDDYMRIQVATGVWEFTPAKDDKIRIVFQFYGDPGGIIPNWLINLFIVTGPFGTLRNMKTYK